MEGRNSYIDQWRGICVLLVVANHLIVFRYRSAIQFDKGISLTSKVIAKVAWFVQLWGAHTGTVGVCVFFCISGYLITLLMLTEETRTGRISLRSFYVRRVFRIVPAMIIYVAAAASLSAVGLISMAPRGWTAPLTFLCNTEAIQCRVPFGHMWTLAIEEQFYLIWPLLLVMSTPRWRSAFVVCSLAAAVAVSTVPELFVRGWISNGLAISCLSSGALFALSARFRAFFSVTQVIPAHYLFFGLCILTPFCLSRWAAWQMVFLRLLPFFIVATVLTKTGSVFPSNGLSNILNKIGLISFSLYLWHALATMSPAEYLIPGSSWVFWLALPAAWLSYRYIELPFQRVGKRLSGRLRNKAHGPAGSAATPARMQAR